MRWEKEVKRLMKQKNLTPETPLNRQIRRKEAQEQYAVQQAKLLWTEK